MKKSAVLLASILAGLSAIAQAQDSEALLKRIDVKSYEGYLQVTPANSKNVNLDINFIRPAYDTQPTTAGAMVGLIQLSASLSNLQYMVDPSCKGEIQAKIGIQEFGGGNVGYLSTTWAADTATDKLSLAGREFQERGGSVEDLNSGLISGRMSKGQWVNIQLPATLRHSPGDILVMEKIRYTSTTDRFSPCKLSIRENI